MAPEAGDVPEEEMLAFPEGAEVPAENNTPVGDSLDAGPQTQGYFRSNDRSTWAVPEGVSPGDWMLKPDKPLRSRHKVLARHAALGKTNSEIAQLLGYSPERVSVLLSNSKIKQEVDLYRDRLYDQDLAQAFKDLLPEALFSVEDVLKHEATSYKDKLAKVDTAKWVIEKIDGKAAQKLNVESGTLTKFFDLLGKMQGEALPPALDVTPGEAGTPAELPDSHVHASAEEKPAEGPDYNAWITENL